MKVYLVWWTKGEYSDRVEAVDGVYTTREGAEKYIEALGGVKQSDGTFFFKAPLWWDDTEYRVIEEEVKE